MAAAAGGADPSTPPKAPTPTTRQELVDQRTVDSRTFLNSDGTYTTEAFAAPINFDDGSGTLAPIDTTPIPSVRTGVAFESKHAPARAELGSQSASGTLLRVVSGSQSIALRPIVPSGVAAATAVDRTPLLDTGHVLYRDVYPNTDLRYSLLPNGAKEDIVLKTAAAPTTFAFAIDAPGLVARLEADGSVSVGTAKTIVFRLPTPFMVDSASQKDGDGERSDKVTYSLITVGTQQVVVMRADPAWLADPTRVFPVYLDPTTVNEVANLDTFITSAYPTSSHDAYWNPNEGGYYELWNGYYDASSGTNYAYVKTPLPSGVTVTSATFNVYAQHTYMGATPSSIYLGKLTSAFVSGQTWNMTQPSWTALTSAMVADNNWATFNVTQLAKDWIYGAATNYGVRIYESSTSQTLWKRLRASENGSDLNLNKPPYLAVTYVHPSNTPTSPINSAWGKGTFSWTYSDNGSGLGQARYWVQVATTSAFTTIKADSTASSGSQTSWTYSPPTGLVTGTTYYWHVSVGDGYSWSGWSTAQTWKFDGVNPAFVSTTVTGAATAADPNYYFLGSGTATVKLRGSDANSGVKLTYQRLYNATDEDRTVHDWSVGGTNCDEFNPSTFVDVTACAETYNSGGTREVQFTDVGLNHDTSFDLHYYFADFAGNILGYVDTGKNLIFDATSPIGTITSPAPNDTVSGSVPLIGSASDANFTQYDLYYGAGANPSTWNGIGTNPRTSPVTNGTLGTWDVSGLATGDYTVRLRVYDKARVSSGYTSINRTVHVDNNAPTAIISAPAASDLLDGSYRVLGTANASLNFANYSLQYGVGCSPGTWLDIGSNPRTSPVTNGILGTWDTTGLAGSYAIKLTVNRSDNHTSTATVCAVVGAGLGRQRQHSFESWDLGAGDQLAVNVVTGNPVLSHPLVSLPYQGGSLDLALTDNGQDATDLGVGPGWQLSVLRRLVLNANGSVTFIAGDGSRHTFTNPVTNGTVTTYTRPATLYATLVKDTAQAEEFTLTYRDQSLDRFDISGSVALLSHEQDRHANALAYTYTGGLLSTITDPAGRAAGVAYTGGHITAIADWAYIDGNGVVQTGATGSHRSYRFFYDGANNLIGWADPLNTTGSCPTGGSHLTCLTYTANQLTAIAKTQTVTTLGGGSLGTSSRTVTTTLTYAGNRVASVTDAEQQALGGSGVPTTFTVESATRIRVNRPTTTTAYGLLAAGDPYGRVQSVWRYLDTTQIERRSVWDGTYPTEPSSVTDNYGALLNTPARTVAYTYQANSLGLLSQLTEPLTASPATNRLTTYSYNANNDVVSKTVRLDTDALQTITTRYCYDAGCTGIGPDLLSQIDNYVQNVAPDDETNVTTDYVYDSHGQRTRVTRHNRDAGRNVLDDRVDAYAYDSSGNQTSAIVNYVDGNVTGGDDVTPNSTTLARTDLTTISTFDTAGNRVSSADPRRAIEAVGGSPGPNDYVTRWTFDALNQQLTEQAPVTPGGPTPPVSSTVYDELGNARTTTDFANKTSGTAFDRVGRALNTFTPPAQTSGPWATTSTTYTPDGQVLTAKDARQTADSLLGDSEYVYDTLGRQTKAYTAAGTADESETDTAYDALDRRTTYEVGVGSPSSSLSTYTYDLGGRVLTTQDGFACTSDTFDYQDRALTTTSGQAPDCSAGADQRTVTHSHDALGRLVRDEVTAGADFGDRTTDDVLDAIGNRLQASTKKGAAVTTSTFTVTLLDQVVAEVRNDGSTAKTTYDAAGNAVDRCLWRGTPVGICQTAGTPGWVNPPDQVTSTTSDARDQRIALTDGATNATTTYDPAHNYQVAAIYQPTAAGREFQTVYSYDDRQRLTGLTFQVCTPNGSHGCTDQPTVVGSDTYAYDQADNRTQVVESNGSTTTDERYCYDGRNQLTGRNTGAACSPTAHDETYTYDAVGNRTQAWVGGVTTNFAYNADGQLCAIGATNCTAPNVTYDSAGRVARDDSWIYTYDSQGRLIEVCDLACTGLSNRVDFSYDGEGHRTTIVATIGGVTTTTTFRYQGDAIVEESTDGTVTRSYVVDDAGAVMKMIVPAGQPDAGTYLVTWNGHGDAVNLQRLNADGTLTLANAYAYSSWGAPTTTTANGIGDLGFRFLYVGKSDVQWDSLVGLADMHARSYSPRIGRFLQPDPAQAEENLYGYVGSNPINGTDPDGTHDIANEMSFAGSSAGGALILLLVGSSVVGTAVYVAVSPCYVGAGIRPGWCGAWRPPALSAPHATGISYALPPVKRTILVGELRRAGYSPQRNAGDHEIWTKPGARQVALPKHREISGGVARQIRQIIGRRGGAQR